MEMRTSEFKASIASPDSSWMCGIKTPRLFFLFVLTVVVVSFAFAGSTGKIAGKVIDTKSKEPLPGVNIVIPGTSMGASTNIDGEYTILNIPPNIYSLRATLLGYDGTTVNGIKVSIDLTTRQDFSLSETVLEQKEVVVTAERALVQKDLTATTAVVGREQIAALPVTEVSQILSLQAGFVSGSLRGGRSGEVAYWIDGVPVTDAFNGSQVVEVNKNLVQELQLVSGAFNAEYGQAMSGIVNIATKEGENKFDGSVSMYGGQYATSSDLRKDNLGGGSSELFPGLDKFKPTAIRNIEANLSGPIFGDKITFFLNGRYIYFDGWLKGFRRFNPQNIAYTDSTAAFHLSRDADGLGDSAVVPMNWSERKYAQGKVTWHLSPLLKVSANFIHDDQTSKAYNRMFFFNPDGIGNNYDVSNTWILSLSHSLNANTFYTVGASFFTRNVRYYLYEDPHDRHYAHPKLTLQDDPYSFLTGGTDLGRFHRYTGTKLVKVDLSSQVNQTHLIKTGVEFRRHEIYFESIQLQPIAAQSDMNLAYDSPYIKTQILGTSSSSHDAYRHIPTEFSGYVQDKMEFSDLIVNIGLRLDYFQPDGLILADESDPSIYTPIKPDNRFFDYNGNGIQDVGEPTKTVADRRAYWYKKASSKLQLSPRFGASFPITAAGVVHFSYGHFFQIPRFERLYENPDFKLGLGTGNQGVVGNADLNPEQTINAEVGVQQQLTDDISVDLTTYIRDIRNLTSTAGDEIVIFGGSAKYSKYVNRDFGFVKGIVLTVNKRFSEGFSSTLDYTYQIARGTASDPQETRNAIAGGALPEVQLTPLAWDQRHTLNATVTYDNHPWGFSLIGQYGSGTPYTPRTTTDISTLLTNSQAKPPFVNVDARAFYEFSVNPFKVVAFLRVFNLFDIRNEVGVFDVTGRAGFTTDEEKAIATHTSQRINSVDQWFRIPTFYSEPRRIELGLNLEF